ncbi:MAG: hypothetical protein AAGG48_29975 [Planctomycetota bacterium]
MANPYDSSTASKNASPSPRPVLRWALLSATLALIAVFVSVPALFILNQEQGFYPLTFGIMDLEFDGESISLRVVMICLFCMSFTTLLSAAAFGITAWYNSRRNNRLLLQ